MDAFMFVCAWERLSSIQAMFRHRNDECDVNPKHTEKCMRMKNCSALSHNEISVAFVENNALSLGDRAQSPCLPLLPLCVQDDRHRLHRCGNKSDAGIAAGRRAAPNSGQPTKPNKLCGHQGVWVFVCQRDQRYPYTEIVQSTPKHKDGHWELWPFVTGFVANCRDWYLTNNRCQ